MKESLRSCIGCRSPRPKKELLRVVRTQDRVVKIDTSGKLSGRGAYVCKEERCFKEALKKDKLAKALKIKPDEINKEALIKEVKEKAGLKSDQESF